MVPVGENHCGTRRCSLGRRSWDWLFTDVFLPGAGEQTCEDAGPGSTPAAPAASNWMSSADLTNVSSFPSPGQPRDRHRTSFSTAPIPGSWSLLSIPPNVLKREKANGFWSSCSWSSISQDLMKPKVYAGLSFCGYLHFLRKGTLACNPLILLQQHAELTSTEISRI